RARRCRRGNRRTDIPVFPYFNLKDKHESLSYLRIAIGGSAAAQCGEAVPFRARLKCFPEAQPQESE
ncbi:MAG: hypothetical protein ABI923_14435, partial [bacterium]